MSVSRWTGCVDWGGGPPERLAQELPLNGSPAPGGGTRRVFSRDQLENIPASSAVRHSILKLHQFHVWPGALMVQGSPRDTGVPHAAMEQKENAVDQDLTLTVVLPGGVEKVTAIQWSQPMMDLLVMLCAKYHLNPSGHTIDLISANRNHIKFKPNALIGTLGAEKILIKPKGMDDKTKKTGPQMPEATVRLIINHRKTQKTILRVNPRVPLEELLPAVCEKCEFDQKTTVLLRDVHSDQPLDLAKSLNDYGLREVYAKDKKGMSPASCPDPLLHQGSGSPPDKDKNVKEKERKGFLSMFRRSKKKNSQAVTSSAPASPVLDKRARSSKAPQGGEMSGYCSNTMPSEGSKKRRAPLPPVMASLSFPSDLNQNQSDGQSGASVEGQQVKPGLSRGSSESSLKRTKRKAPPPPGTVSPDETPLDRTNKAGLTSLKTLEEIAEQEESVSALAVNSGTSRGNRDADMSTDSPVDEQSSRLLEETGEDEPSGLSTDGKPARAPVSHKEDGEEGLKTGDKPERSDFNSSPSAGTGEQAGGSGDVGRTSVEEEKMLSAVSPLSPVPLSATHDSAVQASVCLDVSTTGGDQPESTTAPGGGHAVTSLGVQVSCDDSLPVRPLGPGSSVPEPGQQRRDMATSMEELNPVPVLPQSTTVHQGQVAPVVTSITEKDLRAKSYDELTRDSTPKVGLTTYTITPTKSKEKVKIFEVELTLEAPGVNKQADSPLDSHELIGYLPQVSPPQVSMSPSGVHRYSFQGRPQMTNGAVTGDDAHCGSTSPVRSPAIPEPDGRSREPLSPSGGDVQARPALQGSQKKIPPAVKPKTGSFRSPQHKPTPGYYVTLAAMRDASGSAGCHQRDPQEEPGEGAPLEPPEDNDFPLPPQPVLWEKIQDDTISDPKASGAMLSKLVQQQSAPAEETRAGLSVGKLQRFAAPKPYAAASSSRFAQAVASAVRRSQSFTRSNSSSSCASGRERYSVIELRGSSGDEENFTAGVKADQLQEAEYLGTSPADNQPGRSPCDGGPWKVTKAPEDLPAMVLNGSSVQAEQLE
ncbi:cordon-bleu protein-like 1 isoform X2 [Arapaima gigas]